MQILNLDLDMVSKLNLGDSHNSEIEIDLGTKIKDKIYNKVIIDKSVLDDLKNSKVGGFGLSGVHTPVIDKKGVDYVGSKILFTGVYATKCESIVVYDEVIKGTEESLAKIKIIAGGYSTDLNGGTVLNLVLKVPKDCYYGLVYEGGVMYNGVDTFALLSDIVTTEKNIPMYDLTLYDILAKSNILPPRGVYNKTLYRHFKGKWYMVEGVGEYVDEGKTLVAYRCMYDNLSLYLRDKHIFTSENEKRDEYPLQDYRFMTIKELEYCLGADSKEFRDILIEYNKLINEHPFIIGL